MSWITIKLLGYRLAAEDGELRAQRSVLNFIGATVEDDETNKRTTITMTGTGLLEVTGTPPIVVTENPDSQHLQVAISAATTVQAGSMSASDKLKLDGLGSAQYLLKGTSVPALLSGAVAVGALTDMVDFNSATGTPVRVRRTVGTADDMYEVLQLGLLGTSGADVGNGPKINFYGSNADVALAPIAAIGAQVLDLTTDIETGRLTFIVRTGGVESIAGYWGGDGLYVATNLIVAGTTTTVNSTTVDLADRVVHLNASTGVVAAPVSPAGFVVDRGAAAGPTKRDMPGVLWNEASSRFDIVLNTGGDDSTLGAFVAVKLKALTVSDFSTGVVHSNGSGVLSSSLLVNADVDAAAAIAGTKINPDFGSQSVATTADVGASRFIAAPTIVTSTGGAVTFPLSTAENVEYNISENATVTITGGTVGQSGKFIVTQDNTGRTITMPTASGSLNYSAALTALGVTAMVDTTSFSRTIFHYYVRTGPVLIIYGREVIVVP